MFKSVAKETSRATKCFAIKVIKFFSQFNSGEKFKSDADDQKVGGGGTIAQWNHLCFHSVVPGSNPKHSIYAFSVHSLFYYLHHRIEERTKINKKEDGFGQQF